MKRSIISASATAMLLVASPYAGHGTAADPSPFPLSYSFESATELDFEAACAGAGTPTPVLAPHVLARLAYTRGLASFAVRGEGWFHRRRDGTTARMYIFDNGPDVFEEGLARTIVGGRIAYVDRHLRIRIHPRYDWGDRFDHGRAAVCIGCRSVPVGNGEHSVMEGGRWGMIDRSGREIVPVTLTRAGFVACRDGRWKPCAPG